MPNWGEYRRTNPRLRVLRGYPGNESTHLTTAAPVATGVTIYSGQVIFLTAGTGLQAGQLVWALSADGAGLLGAPHLAFHDSADPDVSASGKLLGLSCAGDFEVQTGWVVGLTGGNATAIAAGAADFSHNSAVSAFAGGLVTGTPAACIIGYVNAKPGGYGAQTIATVTAPLRVGTGGLVDLAWPERVHVAGGPIVASQSYNSESRPNNGDKVTVLNFITRWNGI